VFNFFNRLRPQDLPPPPPLPPSLGGLMLLLFSGDTAPHYDLYPESPPPPRLLKTSGGAPPIVVDRGDPCPSPSEKEEMSDAPWTCGPFSEEPHSTTPPPPPRPPTRPPIPIILGQLFVFCVYAASRLRSLQGNSRSFHYVGTFARP